MTVCSFRSCLPVLETFILFQSSTLKKLLVHIMNFKAFAMLLKMKTPRCIFTKWFNYVYLTVRIFMKMVVYCKENQVWWWYQDRVFLAVFQKFKSFATTKWGYWWQKIIYIQNRKRKQHIISKNEQRKMFLPPSKVFYSLHVSLSKKKIQWETNKSEFFGIHFIHDQLEGGKKLLRG